MLISPPWRSDVPYHLVSTHTKYAPSQAHILAPLQSLLAADDLRDFLPSSLALATVDGNLLGLPRNIDVRLLHYRTDLMATPPETWDQLLEIARKLNRPPDCYGFALTGRDSGLFGTFFELVEMGGAHLFPPGLKPDICNEGGRWALRFLRTLYAESLVAPESVSWHFDEAHASFRDGRSALVCDWPAYYRSYLDPATSQVADRFAVAPYPTGPQGVSLTYGGSHTFGLTRKGAESREALELLRFLTSAQCQTGEARRGSVPVRFSVMQRIQEGATLVEQARWRALEDVIANRVLIPPKFSAYPEVEEVLWRTVQGAMLGRIEIDSALESMSQRVEDITCRDRDKGSLVC